MMRPRFGVAQAAVWMPQVEVACFPLHGLPLDG